MSLFSVSIKCLIVIAFSIFLAKLELWKRISPSRNATIVALGILSARENFIQRETVRSTWLKDYLSYNSDSVKAWFIVGNRSCHIPPQYRLSYYGCEKWNLNVSGLKENFFTSIERKSGSYERTIQQGFSFKVTAFAVELGGPILTNGDGENRKCSLKHFGSILDSVRHNFRKQHSTMTDVSIKNRDSIHYIENVNHPVIVTRLGVFYNALVANSLSKVAIMDVQSKEIIVQATFSSNFSSSIDGYIYSPVEKILFPKDYEGLVIFEGFMLHLVNSSIFWNDGCGVITFKRVYSSPHHLDSKKFTSDLFSIVSIEFEVHELDDLKKIIKEEASVTKQWQLHLEEIQKQIYIENTEHDDLLIVDSIDTYRNLPIKLLKFYKWLLENETPLYVIKTDDDSIINIEALLRKLQEGSEFHPDKLWLWSRFRKDWPVNYIGKWADNDYKSSYYPLFPCGAVYVMSRQAFMWLSSNAENLYPYQGEDVSIGIWLSAINPELIEDDNFECGSSCDENSYNQAQLNPDQMYTKWTNFKECQNFCTCNKIQNVSVL